MLKWLLLLVTLALAGCGQDRETLTWEASHFWFGSPNGVVAKLTLEKVGDGVESGSGQLELRKTEGSQWSGQPGIYPVHWKYLEAEKKYKVDVLAGRDALVFEEDLITGPVANGVDTHKVNLVCHNCETVRSNGLGVIPGAFVSQDLY